MIKTIYVRLEKVHVSFNLKHNIPAIFSGIKKINISYLIHLADRKNPLRSNDLQAHWARAKRQQHLPKELAIHLRVQQYLSFICGKTRDVTWLTPKLCGAGAPNTGQYTMPAESKSSANSFLLAKNKCYTLSLSLPALRLPSER